MRRASTAVAAGLLLATAAVASASDGGGGAPPHARATAVPQGDALTATSPTRPLGGARAGGPATGRLLVTLKPSTEPRARASAVRALAARAGVRPEAEIPRLGTVVVEPATSARSAVRRLRADPRVARVEPERRYRLRYQPNDPAFSTPETGNAGTVVAWWALRQGLPQAWDLTRGDGAKVAVIDTGVDASHPEIAGRIVEAADFDDSPNTGPPTVDEVGHGTHVASLACAAPDNQAGLAGSGLGCQLLVAKSDLTTSSVARSIIWAADRGAESINMSFGGDGGLPPSTVLVEALRYAAERGAVLVAAAADEVVEDQGDPANVLQPTGTGDDLDQGLGLTITAATARDTRASFAGRGSQISMAAYGAFGPGGPAGILAAFPGQTTQLEKPERGPGCRCRTTFAGDQRYAYLQGTSMAAPMVAGVAAMIRHLNPDLSALEVVRLLKDKARRPPGGGWTGELGWGILDAHAAVAVAKTIDRRPPVSRMLKPKLTGRSILLKWTGVDAAPGGVEASGVEHYEVWRQAGNRPARRLKVVKGTAMRLRGAYGSRYGFSVVAVDAAGNREAAPARPEVRVTVKKKAKRAKRRR